MKKALSSYAFLGFLAAVSFFALPETEASDAKKARTTPVNSPANLNVTFSRDVAPILFRNCTQCHRAGEIAPFSLMSYKESRPWARSIKEKVVTREMPPWHADPAHGQFSNDARLSQKDIDTIAAWVDQGAKEGNPKDLPPAPRYSDDWELGKPDMIFSMPEPYTIEASGPDDYIYFRIPTNFTEDKWIQAVEFKAGNKKVVHHAVIFVESPDLIDAARNRARRQGAAESANVPSVFENSGGSIFEKVGTTRRVRQDAQVLDDGCSVANRGTPGSGTGNEILAVYAPGRNADVWPKGMAKRIPKGSNIIFQMHYSKTTGKAERDLTTAGLYFAKAPVEKMISTRDVQNLLFKIPAGAENHEVTDCFTFPRDTQLVNYMPHMHVRGKDMKYEIEYPDGRREILINVPRYNFNWQTLYKLTAPVAVPKGSKLIVTAHFDNSARNKYNPDPAKDVRFGEPTDYEMVVGFIDYVRDIPKERMVAKLDPKVYDAYVGQYSVAPVGSFTVIREGDKLLLESRGQSVQLFPESETKFFLKAVEAEITFVKNEKGEVTGLVFDTNGQSIKARKGAASNGAGN